MTSGRRKDPKVQEIIKKCKDLGISYNTYLRRLQIGWSKEEALLCPRVGAVYRLKDGTPIYSYLKSIGKNYGIFSNSIHLGLSVEDALELALNTEQRKRTKYYRGGMSLSQYCIKHELDYKKEYYLEKKKERNKMSGKSD